MEIKKYPKNISALINPTNKNKNKKICLTNGAETNSRQKKNEFVRKETQNIEGGIVSVKNKKNAIVFIKKKHI